MHWEKNIDLRRVDRTVPFIAWGVLWVAISPVVASADGYLNDVQTTRHLGGVGNYLFRDVKDEAVVEEVVDVTSGKVDFISISNSAPTIAHSSESKSHTLYFKAGSYRLSSDTRSTLDAIVEELKVDPDLRVEISGFADMEDEVPPRHKGRGLSLEELSSARAKAVTKALHERGVLLSRIFWTGQGTLSDNSTAENRRVEVRIY